MLHPEPTWLTMTEAGQQKLREHRGERTVLLWPMLVIDIELS